MRYIIDIDDTPFESNGKKIWKASSFNTLVFDDNGLDRLEQVQEHDGCDRCEYFSRSISDFPCKDCKQNYKDKWTPKTEEIQVGDEVENEVLGFKGAVYYIIDGFVQVLRRDPEAPLMCNWSIGSCHRTGKTYPKLIKALAELPKEGE